MKVSIRFEESNLKSLTALARIYKTSVGHQIRNAISQYLERQKEKVQKELEVMKDEEIEMLNSLMGKSEAE